METSLQQLEKQAAKELQKEIEEIIRKVDDLPRAIGVTKRGKVFKVDRVRRSLNKTAKLFIPILVKNTPKSNKVHYRYVGRGRGNKTVIKYYPGNAKGSMKLIKFKKASPLNAYVGSKNYRGNATEFGRGKYDGYYVKFLEDGSGFGGKKYNIHKKSYDEGKNRIAPMLKKEIENIFRYYARQKKLGKI